MVMTHASLSHAFPAKAPLDRRQAVDKTIELEIDGTRQRLRLCANRPGLPPVLIVQAGPGFPLLNEVKKYRQRLDLEENFLVAYWEQRGCGPAASRDVQAVSRATQVNDLGVVLRRLAAHTGQKAVVLGISLGATVALQAAAPAADSIKALVLVSVDTDLAAGDASAQAFLQAHCVGHENRKIARLNAKLGAPPYLSVAPFQLRARLLGDLGAVEKGRRFGALLRELLASLVRTYGWLGAARTLRNMNAIQEKMLPQLASLNLFANWPAPPVPVHYIFGKNDPLCPETLVRKIADTLTREDSLTSIPGAGHMLHFDEPVAIRALIAQAHSRA